ncbi:hypothetical protein K402DRAFT_395269 [Aulographum hederae CBS 113979]|uniref:Chromo domain-containing protein n=1 Tax=Aulographum hederae CBS 113979 TaxID=1176131 RepID=A0A6G1GVB4_9PEZI|nr:hypothetical protein K402DRAFT_395269 [Aulographum hederae CBS 113979]
MGEFLYEVKWLGYEKKADRTWETTNNLASAPDVLKAYHEKIGGPPYIGGKPKKGKRKQSSGVANTPETGKGRKKAKIKGASETPDPTTASAKSKKKEWQVPKGMWENDILAVDTVEEYPDPETGDMVRYVFVVWNNGNKSRHPLTVINQKCPQKMLQYYEQHLVFKHPPDSLTTGDWGGKT